MLCKNCGTELNENAKFCNSCGAAVETENVPEVSPVPPEDGSENWKGQESFSGEPAAANETSQPTEAAETVEATPTETAPAAPAAKKHTLRNVLIALAVIVVAVLIFRNTGKSETPTGSSGGYNTTSYNSGTSLSAEENWVVGIWYTYAAFSDGDTTYLPRDSGTLYIYDNHTGSIYANGELFDSFTWYYGEYRDGYYFYTIYLSNGGIWAGIYDFEHFAVSGGDSLITFER